MKELKDYNFPDFFWHSSIAQVDQQSYCVFPLKQQVKLKRLKIFLDVAILEENCVAAGKEMSLPDLSPPTINKTQPAPTPNDAICFLGHTYLFKY